MQSNNLSARSLGSRHQIFGMYLTARKTLTESPKVYYLVFIIKYTDYIFKTTIKNRLRQLKIPQTLNQSHVLGV